MIKRYLTLIFAMLMFHGCSSDLAFAQNQVTLQGKTGDRGYTGARGPAGTLAINQVITADPGTPVSIANVGTASNALWNITIPRGSVIFSATGVPSNSTGGNGDFYVQTDTKCLYGPKASGQWPTTCTSLGSNGSGLPGITVTNTPAEAQDFLITTDTTHAVWRRAHPSDLAPDYAIQSFSCSTNCGGSMEIGQSFSNPAFSASYVGGLPTAASISDGTNSTSLTSPFTSGTLSQTYTSSTSGQKCFTLSTTPSASSSTCPASWSPRSFAGIGTAGATGATASGNNAALTGATGTLNSAGLNNQGTYGPFSPSNQTIYIILSGPGHTFKDQNNVSFPMTCSAIAFTNQFGASIPNQYICASSILNSTYTITVAS